MAIMGFIFVPLFAASVYFTLSWFNMVMISHAEFVRGKFTSDTRSNTIKVGATVLGIMWGLSAATLLGAIGVFS